MDYAISAPKAKDGRTLDQLNPVETIPAACMAPLAVGTGSTRERIPTMCSFCVLRHGSSVQLWLAHCPSRAIFWTEWEKWWIDWAPYAKNWLLTTKNTIDGCVHAYSTHPQLPTGHDTLA